MKTQLFAAALVLSVAGTVAGAALADNASASPSPKATPNVSCIMAAVAKRDNSIIAARNDQNSAITSALKTRMAALQAAWQQTDVKTRRVALKAAWQGYNNAAKTANKAYNTARVAAWKQFGTDNKACKAPNDDAGAGAGVDAQ